MSMQDILEQVRANARTRLAERNQIADRLTEIRSAETIDEAAEATERAALTAADSEIDAFQARIAELEDEIRANERAAAFAERIGQGSRSYDQVARTGTEERTYRPDLDPKGVGFLRDIGAQLLGTSPMAAERLQRHMREEEVERGQTLEARATSANFAGLVVPQYLTDLVAPHAKAGRPFADFCRSHTLPADGLTVNISRVTTGTSSNLQANEGDTVSETDIDDTLLTIPVQTNAGSQSLSRQSVERGTGIEDTTLEDLFRAHATRLDTTLLNQATNGLTNVATSIAYTDATPTAGELYPKLLAGPAAAEAALLDMDPGDLVAVMHSRRWYWLNSQRDTAWPVIGQPGVSPQNSGVNYGDRYGSGFRGVLPNGVPVIVDNNIATNLGAGTNEDEIYFVAQPEAHLWEDPNAPMFIRAEQNQAKKLLIDYVVYSYFAYTLARRPHAQKINGTGLVTPTF